MDVLRERPPNTKDLETLEKIQIVSKQKLAAQRMCSNLLSSSPVVLLSQAPLKWACNLCPFISSTKARHYSTFRILKRDPFYPPLHLVKKESSCIACVVHIWSFQCNAGGTHSRSKLLPVSSGEGKCAPVYIAIIRYVKDFPSSLSVLAWMPGCWEAAYQQGHTPQRRLLSDRRLFSCTCLFCDGSIWNMCWLWTSNQSNLSK